MSGDEVLVCIVSVVVALWLWGRGGLRIISIPAMGRASNARLPLVASPVVAAGLLLWVLTHYASHDVVDDPKYIVMYGMLGAAWVGLAMELLAMLGLSARDEVIERGNPAAALALAGAVVGFSLAYAGANIGDGPGWWVVIVCAGLSCGSLALVWLVLAMFADALETITVDRDPAAGLRIGGLLVAAGLVFGRAAAGDWHGGDAALRDFVRLAYPAGAALLPLVVLERQMRPTVEAPRRSVLALGLLPALLYILLSAAYVAWCGQW